MSDATPHHQFDCTHKFKVRRLVARPSCTSTAWSQADIGHIIGSESTVSMFLHGDRALSKSQIRKLAGRFKVDAAVFME